MSDSANLLSGGSPLSRTGIHGLGAAPTVRGMAESSSGVPPRRKGGAGKGRPPSRPTAKRPPQRRRGGRRGRTVLYGISGVLVLVAAIILIVVLATSGSSGRSRLDTKQQALNWTTPDGVPVYGTLSYEGVPLEVGPQLAQPNTGLTGAPVAGVNCLGQEQLQYHHHVHLAIFINGQPRSVPLAVGMTPPAQVEKSSRGDVAVGPSAGGCFYWLHVHEQDGIIHIESPLAKTFVLGQFFAIWHVALSSDQIGQYKGAVTATVDRQPWSGDPASIPLIAHSQIVLNLGTPIISPAQISWSGTGL
jgi:hypothetical protein